MMTAMQIKMPEGQKLYIFGPIREHQMFDGYSFTCGIWSGRHGECRINGKAVNPIVYEMVKRRRRRLTPLSRFRWNLRRYIAPLARDVH